MTVFQPFPKLSRLSRECVITEKLDGTNAQVYIVDPETLENEAYEDVLNAMPLVVAGNLLMFAGSRTRLIYPGKNTDNYGFAAWVYENHQELLKLGEGRHFGEWWGKGIQRGYGLDEKRFSLFHMHNVVELPACVSVVPTLYEGHFDTVNVEAVMQKLWWMGSHASPGFMNPEGIVVFHTASKTLFKKTFDDKHKEA